MGLYRIDQFESPETVSALPQSVRDHMRGAALLSLHKSEIQDYVAGTAARAMAWMNLLSEDMTQAADVGPTVSNIVDVSKSHFAVEVTLTD